MSISVISSITSMLCILWMQTFLVNYFNISLRAIENAYALPVLATFICILIFVPVWVGISLEERRLNRRLNQYGNK